MAKVDPKVKAAKDGLRPFLKDIRTAESVLFDAQRAAAPYITVLNKAAGKPGPHKIRVDDKPSLYTFRKAGDYVADDGKTTLPLYSVNVTDLGNEDDE